MPSEAVLAGLSVPAFRVAWRAAIDLASLRALRGLRDDLIGAVPGVAAGHWQRGIAGSVCDPRIRLIRRTAEIRDATLALRCYVPAGTVDESRRRLAALGLTATALDAAAEACWLELAIRAVRAGTPAGQPAHVLPGGATLREEVRWLRQVAAAVHSGPVRAVAAELADAPLTHNPGGDVSLAKILTGFAPLRADPARWLPPSRITTEGATMGSSSRLGAAALAIPLIASLGVAFAAGASGVTSPAVTPATACGTGPVQVGLAVDGVTLDPAQMSDARVIYDVSVTMGLPQPAAVIGEATAMQESQLINLPYGTSDSLGLFQQRPSQGWGTPAQIMQPVYASTRFYEALAGVPGWQSLPLTVAAQAVQGSATPDAYAKWEPLASSLVATFSGSADNCLTDNGTGISQSGTTHFPAGFALPSSTPQAVVTAIAYTVAQLGKPYIWGGVGPAGYDCSGLVMMAYEAAGISLPRTTFQQVDAGTPVYSDSQLEAGDLLFTPGSDGTAADPGHVGMYIGSGLVIQAPETGENIEITPFSGYWQENTVAIRRIV